MILIPTLDYTPNVGGVARYIAGIQKTFPKRVEVRYFDKPVGRLSLFLQLWNHQASVTSMWTHHLLPIGTMLWLQSFIGGKPYTVFLHGMDFDLARRSRWKRFLTRRILKRAQHIVTNTQALADEVATFVQRKPIVVYPFVNDALVEASGWLQRKRTDNDQFTVLTVARLVPRKGHLTVLEAIRDLPDVDYVIAGDGVMRTEIESFVKAHGMEERVTLLQNVSDRKLANVYHQADLFLMPAQKTEQDREGFGIVYLEAQLFGVPVIAMNTPGVNEAVQHDVGGVLLDNVSALKATIVSLKENQKNRNDLGAAGRQFVLKQFTREQQCRKLEAIL